MRALNGELLLTAWERARTRPDPWRAIALVETASPEAGELAELPLAQINRMLAELHRISFGELLQGFAACTECGAPLEFALKADEVEQQMLQAQRNVHAPTWMRPVNTADVVASLSAASADEAVAILISRTMLDETASEASLESRLELAERVNAAAEVRCTLLCTECGARPVLDLDLPRFLWAEVAVAARRLLAEIHALASTYGWSEGSILSLSAARRDAYLEMVRR